MMTQIGFLMLMGLVMKNGILLVDYTNQLRERGLALREAVLEAGPAFARYSISAAPVGRGEGSR